MLMCVLDLYVDIAVACIMMRRHVAAQSIMSCYPCTHAHTKKKKKNCTCYKRFVGVTRRSLHMVSERVQPVTWDRYGFRCYDLIILLLIELTCVRAGNHG
jgi:hypothetical protein